MNNEIIVVKIGGSTMGKADTTLADVAELHKRGEAVVVVHGGGPMVSDWLTRMNEPTKFEGGRRVTDEGALDVVVAVLAGLVNKRIVASLSVLGVVAVGLSGCDGAMLRARVKDESLGFVGEIVEVDPAPLMRVALAGGLVVIAPIGIGWNEQGSTGQLLNINADDVAGDLAAALQHSRLVLMSDVPGVMSEDVVIPRISLAEAHDLIARGVIHGGMIPKVEASLRAAQNGNPAHIVGASEEHALLSALEGKQIGTVVG